MLDMESIDRGLNMMSSRLLHRRVFVVLDNLDHIDQLKPLAGENKWFGSGSRIIITNRNEHLLKVFEVDGVCTVPRLCLGKSFQLFSWHAFRKDKPPQRFMKLSRELLRCAEGLPLEEKLKRIPNEEILNKLRVSFDVLNDDEEKNVFMDIAHLFVGMDKDYVLKILQGCGFSSEIVFFVLTQRCLIVIDEDNRLKMHDLIRDMKEKLFAKNP
ncbi:hypothetical protein CISIN_1g047158mg [Citrus sinensis]|uniref:Disease resistance protein Roq1-like winged-helix domain-containing protein n=1 Tax=Citrus sinensis TaxID=2711 RepID=A0A067E8V6_CITSI|nr:hypothetical protein CISIN_1g047158mg [Citrus sinensis]